MTSKTWNLGLIGWPLEHTFSPRLHRAAFQSTRLNGVYTQFPTPPLPEGLLELEARFSELRDGLLDGVNVTIPHKRAVLPYLDQVTPAAKAIGAVNTIIRESGELVGENTDEPAFLADLIQMGLPTSGKVIILGAGGAARAAAHGLYTMGWHVVVAARRLEQARALLTDLDQTKDDGDKTAITLADLSTQLNDCSLVVNATPVGMAPHVQPTPWPLDLEFPRGLGVYDMVYNPLQTKLVRDARAAGLKARGGIGMLVEQAALAFEAWTGARPSREKMLAGLYQQDN